jgi:hypothetical protein
MAHCRIAWARRDEAEEEARMMLNGRSKSDMTWGGL